MSIRVNLDQYKLYCKSASLFWVCVFDEIDFQSTPNLFQAIPNLFQAIPNLFQAILKLFQYNAKLCPSIASYLQKRNNDLQGLANTAPEYTKN
jgi:hypothetical protein